MPVLPRGTVVARNGHLGVVWQDGPDGLVILPALWRPDERHRSDVPVAGWADASMFGMRAVIRVGWATVAQTDQRVDGAVSAGLLAALEAASAEEWAARAIEAKWRGARRIERAVRM